MSKIATENSGTLNVTIEIKTLDWVTLQIPPPKYKEINGISFLMEHTYKL